MSITQHRLTDLERTMILFRSKDRLQKYSSIDKVYTQMSCGCVFETHITGYIGGYNTNIYMCCDACFYTPKGNKIVKNMFKAQNVACIHNVCELLEKYDWQTQSDIINSLLSSGVDMKQMKAHANEIKMKHYTIS